MYQNDLIKSKNFACADKCLFQITRLCIEKVNQERSLISSWIWSLDSVQAACCKGMTEGRGPRVALGVGSIGDSRERGDQSPGI